LAALQRRRKIKPVSDGPRGDVSFTPFLGMILIVSSFFLYAASGLIAPWWGIVAMVAIWLVLFIVCCVSWTPNPKRLVWIGALSYPLWFCLIVSGALIFGWDA
jgi:peptidoglycan/LPS O-acetylase OafA/YrhL